VAKQAWALYVSHRRDISKSLRLNGTPEALQRNLVIQINGCAAGRPGEVASLSLDVMSWDPMLDCTVALWPQIKTHKQKLIVLTAGRDRWICPITNLATCMAAGVWKTTVHSENSMNYLFPQLAASSAKATAIISSWLKNLVVDPCNKNEAYKFCRVKTLHKDVTASGQRVGALNEMAANGVCAEFNAAVSGHELDTLSRLWTYLNVEAPVLIPGVTVLGGWPGNMFPLCNHGCSLSEHCLAPLREHFSYMSCVHLSETQLTASACVTLAVQASPMPSLDVGHGLPPGSHSWTMAVSRRL
jgi:hypothetical protein